MATGPRCCTCLVLAQVITLVHAGACNLNGMSSMPVAYLTHYKTGKVSGKLILGWKSEGPAGQRRKMSSKPPEPGGQMQNRRKHMKMIMMIMMMMTMSRRMWASPWRRMQAASPRKAMP